MTPQLLPAAPAPSRADEKWLSEKVGVIRTLFRNTAENLIRIGLHLAEVRERIGGGLKAWVHANFPFGHATAYKMIRVAEVMAPLLGNRRVAIDASALYMLAEPRTSAESRRVAVAAAVGGQRITPAFAREIIVEYRAPAVTEQDVAKYARAREKADRTAVVGLDQTQDHRLLWTILCKLVAGANEVRIAQIADAEDAHAGASSSGNGVKDRSGPPPLMLTVYPPDGKLVSFVTQECLEVLLLQASGQEPLKRCTRCKVAKRLYTDFSRKGETGVARCGKCKICERARVAEAKRRKAAGKPKKKKYEFDFRRRPRASARFVPDPGSLPPGPSGTDSPGATGPTTPRSTAPDPRCHTAAPPSPADPSPTASAAPPASPPPAPARRSEPADVPAPPAAACAPA